MKMFLLLSVAICIVAFFGHNSLGQKANVFPLTLSENSRYLKDNNNKPFLIKEFSAWGVIQALSEPDEAAFLDSIVKKGFNTVLVSIISNAPSQMGGSPPYWQGVSPFKVQWDFSTPNEVYFKHVDRFFEMAATKGVFVMAVPVYLGYRGDPSQGWFDEMLTHNDTTRLFKYGQFIGQRYRHTPNVMWVAGGDHNADGRFYPYELNLIKGIKSKDPRHYWTGHFDCNLNVFWSTQNPLYASFMDIDGQYVWTESVMFEQGPQYASELRQYKKGKMIIQLDQSYEHTKPYFADNENYYWMRRKVYDGLLSGCAGTSFCSGEVGNSCVSFKQWQKLMNTQGMYFISHCFALFETLPWENMVPDGSDDIIYQGRGEFGTIDYVCAAQTTDKRYYVIYLPKGQHIFLNMKKMSGKPMRMHWFNPRTGKSLKLGVAETREKFGVVPPSEEDWLLLFDDDKDFSPPELIH